MDRIDSVPTNVITGFLGVGKTSAILDLLANKPNTERWAVLVNEFGEIGIDGGLISGANSEADGIFVKEVPGGCMCCAAGLPMKMALNMLLTRARPDRLLIEPTGLGHPQEVIAELLAPEYHSVLDLQAVVTLVDARNLSKARYREHDTFRQQLQVADVIVANKSDLYGPEDEGLLRGFIAELGCAADIPVCVTQQGKLPAELLTAPTQHTPSSTEPESSHAHSSESHHTEPLQLFDQSEIVAVENQGRGFQTCGWRFPPEKVFSRDRLLVLLSGLDVERAKGIFITEEGVFGYNKTPDTLTEMELDDCFDSRLELIAISLPPGLESQIVECLEG